MNNLTYYGFDFGSMTITRTCEDKKASIVSVSTEKAKFSIRATPNGSLRFFDDQGNECDLVQRDYLRSNSR